MFEFITLTEIARTLNYEKYSRKDQKDQVEGADAEEGTHDMTLFLECTPPVFSHDFIHAYRGLRESNISTITFSLEGKSEAIFFQLGVFGDRNQVPEYGAPRYTRDSFIFCFR